MGYAVSLIEEFVSHIEKIDCEVDASLSAWTTFRVGGHAAALVRVTTKQQLLQVMQAIHRVQIPFFVLGGGSNLLMSDTGFDGVVIRLKGDLARIDVHANKQEIVAGAGAAFPALTRAAVQEGCQSAVGWAGTPGTVGGALCMNAGSRLGEIGDVVHRVEGIANGYLCQIPRQDIVFSYRHSSLRLLDVLTCVWLRFQGDSSKAQQYQQQVRQQLSKRRLSQPKGSSAGSVFRNPPGDFAGRLIEACGLKGRRVGKAEISQQHANFIINTGDACAQDIYALSCIVRREVKRVFGVLLEYEMLCVGQFQEPADQK
ncbi:MAG: UDP-N-acetylmuramate dehydrogenase [Myxococcota bacterium]